MDLIKYFSFWDIYEKIKYLNLLIFIYTFLDFYILDESEFI
jgi:hypothetical protein